MSLQFILGNSGSGKSDDTYKKIVKEAGENPQKNYLVLVPEQFTMQTQRKLVELAPFQAIMNVDVLSFKRLAYRVFDELGISNLNVLEETGKNLILRRLAGEKKDQLTILKKNISRMGYIGELKSLISELVQYDVSPDQLEAYSNRKDLSDTFAAKLKDIVVMYRSFQDYMAGHYVTAEEILNILILVADQSEILKDSVMVLDEFTGFTPIQNKLLRRLLPICDRIQVILTIDEKENLQKNFKEHELFYLTGKTMKSLTMMAQELKVPVLSPLVLGKSAEKRFKDSEDLAFLEKNLFRLWYQVRKEPVRDIRIASLADPRDELYQAAREISRLVREENFRYRDIAIVTGSVENYENYVEEVCRKYQIPWFMDQTTQIVFHPFIETVRAILQIVCEDFSYEAVFRFLRSGFSDFTESEIDFLENYVLAIGIRGRKAWENRWLRIPKDKLLLAVPEKNEVIPETAANSFPEPADHGKEKEQEVCGLEKLNQLRRDFMDLFAPLCDAFQEKRAVSVQILELYHILLKLQAEQKLWKKEKEYLEAGEQTKSREYGQIYRIVMELLEKFNRLLGKEIMDAEEFAEILDAGLSEAQVGSIPPGYDCVTVGDIERTRLNHIKILFFIGVNDGIIPKASGSGGIISEFEREMLQEARIELAPGAREQAFIQRFYLYRNLTKPSRKLYLSFARVDSAGKAIRPSYLIGVLQHLFSELRVEEYDRLKQTLSLTTEEAALDYLVYGTQDASWYALADYFLNHSDEETQDMTRRLLSARYHTIGNEPISRIIADAIYGKELTGSVTRLEQFASCAYSHFLKYGLRLQERENNQFENVDIGNIYHEALQKYSQKVEQSEYDWFKIPDRIREAYSREALAEAVLEYPNVAEFGSSETLHQTARMEEIFVQTVWALTEQVRAGKFVPSEFEISFSQIDSAENLKLKLNRDHSMLLRGRIDRMDLFNQDGDCYIKIIDYKSGSEKFELIRVYRGLSLQLSAYMNASMKHAQKKYPQQNIRPGALFYYNINDPAVEVSMEDNLTEDEILEQILMQLRPDGIVNCEETAYRAMDEELEGKSRVIPLTLKKDGTISKSASKAVSEGEFAIICNYVENKMAETGRKIYEGDISINPYDSSIKKSCTYCPYSGICGINSRMPGAKIRGIDKMDQEEILEKMDTYNAMAEAGGLDTESGSIAEPSNTSDIAGSFRKSLYFNREVNAGPDSNVGKNPDSSRDSEKSMEKGNQV